MSISSRTRRLIVGVVGLVAAAAFGVALSLARPSSPQSAAPAERNVFLPSAQTSGDCAALGNESRVFGNISEVIGWTIEQWTDDSEVVAEVTVTQIGDVRFNTPSGAIPTPAPPDAEEFSGIKLYRAYAFTVTQGYKGDPSVTGYVVAQFGGTSSLCPSYTYKVDPVTIDATATGAAGMFFLEDPPASLSVDPEPWYAHLQQVATSLSTGGATYQVKLPRNWFRYQGTDARSAKTGMQLTVNDLQAQVQAALP